MSDQVSAVPAAPSQNPMPETSRRSANFHPSIWGDHFLAYASEVVLKVWLFYFISLVVLTDSGTVGGAMTPALSQKHQKHPGVSKKSNKIPKKQT
jgi:hypothetical protein